MDVKATTTTTTTTVDEQSPKPLQNIQLDVGGEEQNLKLVQEEHHDHNGHEMEQVSLTTLDS